MLLIKETIDNKHLQNQSIDCFFVCFGEKSILQAMMYAEQIRDRIPSLNLKVNLGSESAGSQFKKADKSGARLALILGDSELDDGLVSCKDLRKKSEQETMDLGSLIGKIENTFIKEK
jgi:histidyl-tRNA synthetase